MKYNLVKIQLAALLAFSSVSYAAPTVYIPLGSGNQVITVDAATDKIIASYTGVENSHGLVATPDGEYLIAGSLMESPPKAGQPKDSPTSQLFIVHPEHGHVMSTIPVLGWTHHQAITPDGRYVLSTHGGRGFVSVVDLQKNIVLKTIETGLVPNYTLISKDGKRAFVSNSGDNSIAEVDLINWEVIRKIEGGASPEHMVFSKDEATIYVTNPRAGVVSVISVSEGKIASEYKIGADVHGLDIGDDGKTLFISSKKDDKLVAVDTHSGETRSVPLIGAPYHLNSIDGTGKVYVSSRRKPIIWVVDQKTMKVLSEIKLPAGEGHQMAIVN